MPTIRTTQEPWRDVVVTDDEYVALLKQGLVYLGATVPPPPTYAERQLALLEPNLSSKIAERIDEVGVLSAEVGAAGGVADLDGGGKVPESRIPTRLSDDALASKIGALVPDAGAGFFAPIEVVNPGALRKWWLALGKRQSSPVRVIVTGNSKREGTGATNNVDRFPLALQDRLRRAFQPQGILGAVEPNIHLAGMSPVPAGMQYAVAGSAAGSQYGFGGRGFKLVSGTTVTVTTTGDRIRIWYIRASGGGLLDVTVDGGEATQIDTYKTGAQAVAYHEVNVTRGAHTIVLTRNTSSVAGRDIFIGDVEVFDGDFARGVRVYDASRHGVTAAGIATSQTGWTDEYVAIGGFGLLVIGLGENDGSRTASEYKADIEAVIAWHRARGFASSVLLMHDAKPGNVGSQTLWDSFGEAERQIAVTDADVAWVNLAKSVPGYTSANPLGIYSDDRHCTSAGQGWQADLVASAIMPRVLLL